VSGSTLPILVVGSIALDTVRTPAGEMHDGLGGSASYFGLAAAHYCPVRMVAVVGDDFPKAHLETYRERGLDLRGLQTVEGKTFRWEGVYSEDMNDRETLRTELNVFEGFHPVLPEDYRETPCVLLANIDPLLQLEVLGQMKRPKLVALDTMNYWIVSRRETLLEVLARVDLFLLNDSEARLLTGCSSVLRAAEGIRMLGPSVVVIKRGDHGALVRTEDGWFSIPAFPVEEVKDPTGAGDAFAGGLLGWLARHGGSLEEATLRRAIAHGSAVASFVVEEFSVRGFAGLEPTRVQSRVEALWRMTQFDPRPRTDEGK